MADYTYLNNVPCPRIHKHNASTVKEDCDEMLKLYRERLLVLTASSPTTVSDGDSVQPWTDFVQSEVAEIWQEILDTSHRQFCAEYIIENPEEVDDELE